MFVQTPCSLPNSQAPISQARIDAERRLLSAVSSSFVSGNQTLNNLVDALGGNSSATVGGNAGVPTLGPYGGKWPALQWGGPSAQVAKLPSTVLCSGAPEVVPLLTVLPVRDFTLPAPAVTAPRPPAAIAPAPAPAAVVPQQDPGICNYTPETVCAAIRAGCFKAGQVDDAQLAACAKSGWSGNENRFPWLIAKGGANGGARVGLVNPNPRFPDGRAPELWGGMAGFDDGDPRPIMAGFALALFAGAYVWNVISERKGRRR